MTAHGSESPTVDSIPEAKELRSRSPQSTSVLNRTKSVSPARTRTFDNEFNRVASHKRFAASAVRAGNNRRVGPVGFGNSLMLNPTASNLPTSGLPTITTRAGP